MKIKRAIIVVAVGLITHFVFSTFECVFLVRFLVAGVILGVLFYVMEKIK